MRARHIHNASTFTGWRKSSHSGGDNGSCVEVIDGMTGVVPVRDSKTPSGPALVIADTAWNAFVDWTKA